MSHLLGRKTSQGRTTHLSPGLLAVRSHCGLAPGRVRPLRSPSPLTLGGRQTVFTGESQRAGWAGYTRSEATGHRSLTWPCSGHGQDNAGARADFLQVAQRLGALAR